MQKRSSGSFARDPVSADQPPGKGTLIALLAALAIFSAGPIRANDSGGGSGNGSGFGSGDRSPAPPGIQLADPSSPSPEQILKQQKFFALPVYDLVFVDQKHSGNYDVGDEIELTVSGFTPAPQASPSPLLSAIPSNSGISGALANFKVSFPPGTDDFGELGWEVMLDEQKTGLTFVAVPTREGQLHLDGLAIVDASGEAVARTRPLVIAVGDATATPKPAPSAPVPLKPPVHLPFPWVWAVALGVLGFFALALMGYFAFRAWKKAQAKKRLPPAPLPPRPVDELAIEALENIRRSGWLAMGKHKAHYFGISEALKAYIGARYQFDARESTSQEVLSGLKSVLVPPLPSEIQTLRELFESMDQVKFTDYRPSPEEGEAAVASAIAWVLATRARPSLSSDVLPTDVLPKGGPGNAV